VPGCEEQLLGRGCLPASHVVHHERQQMRLGEAAMIAGASRRFVRHVAGERAGVQHRQLQVRLRPDGAPQRQGRAQEYEASEDPFQERFLLLSAQAFTASPGGIDTVKFKLSRKNLKALKRTKRLRFIVTVAFGGTTFTTNLTLKAPR
jgi:hypothetical protein